MSRDLKVTLEQRDRQGHRDHWDRLAALEILELRDILVRSDSREHQEILVLQELLDKQDHQGHRDSKEVLVQRVSLDHRAQ